MNRRTQAIIGVTVVLLGAGVVALGFLDDEATVRYVADIIEDPNGHASGKYTLLGVPQPRELAVIGSDGAGATQDNPSFVNETTRVVGWHRGGTLFVSTLTVTVEGPDAAGVSHWSVRNETREAGRPALVGPATQHNWTITGPHLVFLIEGFIDSNGDTPAVFGVYRGTLREPMQPKPSQFQGHVMTSLPDGSPVPGDALVYWVEEYTAGCSSKFLPPEAREEYSDKHNETVAARQS